MKTSKYQAIKADENGFFHYSKENNSVWQQLIMRQLPMIEDVAYQPILDNIRLLDLPLDRIPQHKEINEKLAKINGWAIEAVPAIIPFDDFFDLMSHKKFPVATFIRTQEDFDYIEEPDIFHEVFGHCHLLPNQSIAHFSEFFGVIGKEATSEQRKYLSRLWWWTVEFGMIKHRQEKKIYGAGILSGPKETQFAMSNNQQCIEFDLEKVLRTAYRIDLVQPSYFTITDFTLFDELRKIDLLSYIEKIKHKTDFILNYE